MARPEKYAVTADVVLFARRGTRLVVLVIRRQHEPFRGRWALPGGFVEPDEDLEPAARRELREETGLDIADVSLRQLAAYGAPGRDPRGRTVTIAFTGLADAVRETTPGDDASSAEWIDVDELLASDEGIAFDHSRIIRDGLARLGAS